MLHQATNPPRIEPYRTRPARDQIYWYLDEVKVYGLRYHLVGPRRYNIRAQNKSLPHPRLNQNQEICWVPKPFHSTGKTASSLGAFLLANDPTRPTLMLLGHGFKTARAITMSAAPLHLEYRSYPQGLLKSVNLAKIPDSLMAMAESHPMLL